MRVHQGLLPTCLLAELADLYLVAFGGRRLAAAEVTVIWWPESATGNAK